MLAGSQRPRIGRESGERDEAALAGEDELLVGVDVPQRTQAERIDAEEADVLEPREERGGTLGEGPEGGTALHVGVLQLLRHSPDLGHDRGEDELGRLDRIEAEEVHHLAQGGVDVLRIAPGGARGAARASPPRREAARRC